MILATDKTQLSTFSGDKQCWPVYATIGNIHKSVRRKPSERANILLGYLPVTKFFSVSKEQRSVQSYRLFHLAMRTLLQPLVSAGRNGVLMTCADGKIRKVHPILASYIADYPEQCLVTVCKENRCPTCKVHRLNRGDQMPSPYRDPTETLALLRDHSTPSAQDVFEADGIRDVPEPFWMDLPYTNIFVCITPDLLHQLHKGVFKDHLVKWTTSSCEAEIDARFMRLPPYNNLREFKKGISGISQWTGTEYRQMEKVFIGVLAGLFESQPRVLKATRAIIDFIYLAHYPTHSTSTLCDMATALDDFHANKTVFIDIQARQHFNIPKLHSTLHYIPSIMTFGTCDGFSTEISERLHIDFAKVGYRASNRKEFLKQMVNWLTRQEKIDRFTSYLHWLGIQQSTDAADILGNADTERESDGDEDGSILDGGVVGQRGSQPPHLPMQIVDVRLHTQRVDLGSVIENSEAQDADDNENDDVSDDDIPGDESSNSVSICAI